MNASRFRLAAGLAVACIAGSARDSGAQSPPAPASDAARAEKILSLEQKLDAAAGYIQKLRGELDALKTDALKADASKAGRPAFSEGAEQPAPAPTTAGQPAPAPTPAPTPATTPTPPPPAPQTAQAATPTPPPPKPREATPPPADEESGPSPDQDRPVFTPAFLRSAQAVLIPRNKLEITPSFQYGFSDSNILAVKGLDIIESVFIGTIGVEKQRRHGLTGQLDARYGITDRIQASLSVPYRFIAVQTFDPPTIQRFPNPVSEQLNYNHHIGDIEAGLSYHTLRENGWIPDLILGITGKSTTGTGPWEVKGTDAASGSGFMGIRGSATVVKVSDPGILFASGSYMYHVADKVPRPSAASLTVDPGDVTQISAGYAYALNPYLSITTRVEANYVNAYTINDKSIDGTDQWLSTLSFGVTYGLNRGTALDFGFELGLTDDSPDFRFTLGAPLQWTLPPWGRVWDRVIHPLGGSKP